MCYCYLACLIITCETQQIAYAKTKSNAVKNRDGSYSKRSRAAAIEMNGNESDASDDDTLHKRQRGDEYDSVTTGRHLKDNEEEMEEGELHLLTLECMDSSTL